MPAILTCTIWWPAFGNIDSPLFLLSTQFSTLNQSWKASCVIFMYKHLVRFVEKHAQSLNTSQNNSASWDLQMGFNSAFKGLIPHIKDLWFKSPQDQDPFVCPCLRVLYGISYTNLKLVQLNFFTLPRELIVHKMTPNSRRLLQWSRWN